ncbi:helix-turn-helix transcriptional regulator [Streptomyces sannanensis]|uniref:Helix-turn-helix transcriptional regulator n=2 Tax=Streptomyces sannanensis TaxID=285536 RepID=A0ABP6SLS0_9ACTN
MGGLPRLDARAVAVFEHVLSRGSLRRWPPDVLPALGLSQEEIEGACHTLLLLRLLRPAPGKPEELIPISPNAAAAEVVGPLEAQLAQAAAHAQSVRDDLYSLMPYYHAARREQGRREGIDLLPDLASASAMLTEESARCREEVFSIQPGGGRAPHRLGDAIDRDLAMLRRGVRMRTLYQHSARSSLSTQGYVETLTEAGAEYRTAAELPDRAVVFDRVVAFLPRRAEGGSGEAAVLVRDPDVVTYLCRVFEQHWSGATPFRGSSEAAYKEVGPSLRRALVGLLADGAKDEVIARRMGMSLRTCRRHIAELLDELGAESRFQGGALAERAGLTAPETPAVASAAGPRAKNGTPVENTAR